MKEEKLTKLEIQELRNLAHFLEGWAAGKGNLFSLGTHTLTTLWMAIKILK